MQKIAFHLNSLQQGGAERVVSNLANRFAKEGYEVVIATEWYGTDEFALDQKVRRVHVGLTKEDENRSRISKMLRRIWYLRRFMKKEKPDVVVAFTRGVLYRALAAGIGTGIPVVISVRTDPVGHYDKKADKLRIPLLFPHAAGCVFQTEGAKAFFAPYLQENARIILNPLNPKYVGVPEPAVRTKNVVQSGRKFTNVNHFSAGSVIKDRTGNGAYGNLQIVRSRTVHRIHVLVDNAPHMTALTADNEFNT